MAGSFGGVTCDYIHNIPAGPVERIQTFYMPGIDYAGVQALGLGGEWSCNLVRFGANLTITSWLASIRAKVGYSITIMDEAARSVTRCVPTEIGPPQRTSGGPSYVRCEVVVKGVYG